MQAKSLEFLKTNPTNIITKNYSEAILVGEVAKYLNIDYVILPDFRANFGDDMRSYKEEVFELNSALFEYYNSNSLLISPINTILRKLPNKKYFDFIKLEFADTINLNELKEKLVLWGYEVVSIIQEKGEVSFRGDIIDIYPVNSDTPYRISLFDTEIENIRTFDEFSQISKDEVENIEIIPALASLDNKEYEKINEKIEKSKFDVFYKDIYSLGFWFLEKEPIIKQFNLLYDMTGEIEDFKLFNEAFEFETHIIEQGKCKQFKPKNIKEFIELNPDKNIELLAKNEVLLKEKNINYPFIKSDVVLNVQCPEKTIISLNEFKSKKKKTLTILINDLKRVIL
jgi:transcription-repair coupling factor (superfamily II helicase)